MVLLFLAEGFEEAEALVPLDVIRRAKIPVKTVGVSGKTVTGSHGITVTADVTADELDELFVDAVILPGGMPGAMNLNDADVVDRYLSLAHSQGALLAAICAAPLVLGRRGYLAGKRARCYPGYEADLAGAVIDTSHMVIRDGNIITAVSMAASLEFGLAIVEVLRGKAVADKIRTSLILS